MANIDVTNPGLVNVANEGFGTGPIAPNECVEVSPSSNPGTATPAIAGGPSGSAAVVSVTNPGVANVADETFGTGLAANVHVS
jgi:hypothetical protein